MIFFFFSSRRRHTRFKCDWSSDVCSSDLVHVLDLREDGAVSRAIWALAWPLALLGRPSELRLAGPNHCEGQATFHDLRLGWVPLAARFGLKVALELPLAGFDGENGEV